MLRELISEMRIANAEKRRFSVIAKNEIQKIPDIDGNELYKNWFKDYKKYNVSFDEYWFRYHFPDKNEGEKAEYISFASMQKLYRKYGSRKVRAIFRDKKRFLEVFHDYVFREWMVYDRDSDRRTVEDFLHRFDVIAKPLNGTHGIGVSKFKRNEGTLAMLDQMAKEGPILLEECIQGNDQISAFHPSSLNTIRYATFSNGKDVIPMWATLRTGNHGNCIDNAHGGGINCLLDVNTGIALTDGTHDGTIYSEHPMSHIVFKGFQVPLWDEVKKTCHSAALELPEIRFAGWDVAIRSDGRIELIEGNHAPDVDGIQTLCGKGIREHVLSKMKQLSIL